MNILISRFPWLCTAIATLLAIQIHDIHGQTPGNSEITVEKIADGFQFVEGPVWENGGLLFSDIPANTVYRWTPDSVAFVYLSPSGNSNGLALDLDGHLLLAQHGKRQVARLETDGSETILASHFEGKKLNSPNDLVVKSDGSIFFTDPPYGIQPNQEELGFYGIYRLSPSGSLQLLDASLYRPNGLAFSPDEKKLYVSDSEARRIYVWDVLADTLLRNKKQFAFMNASGNADGMKVDAAGRLFATGPFGIWVYDEDGNVLDTIMVPGQTTNCNWGDADGLTLYITSGSAVYRARPIYSNLPVQQPDKNETMFYKLYDNYPNPFNSSTKIQFYIAESGWVKINIFNLLGKNVETLVNRFLKLGQHHVSWEAENMSSGMYYINLVTQHGSAFKKCLLVK